MKRKQLIVIPVLLAALHLTAQRGASSFDFIENKGQWEKQVQFKSSLSTGAFFLQQNGFTVIQHNGDDLNTFFDRNHEGEAHTGNTRVSRPDRGPGKPSTSPPPPLVVRSHAYRVQFAGANMNSTPVPEKPIPSHTSYFIGNDPSQWAADVPSWQAIVYKNIYPNIDVRYYSEDGRLKYDLIVHPGGDVSKIAMQYEGPDKLQVKNTELIIKTSVGDLKELYPYTYQFDMTTGKKEINCRYELVNGNTVKFRVDNYSKTSTLVIDPTLVFCSFTGSAADQYGYTATPGPDGSLYSGGIVFDRGFPTTPGAYQADFQGGTSTAGGKGIDMGIFKFTPNGQRSYATYLGGTGNDYPHSLICDPQGNLVVMGKTTSSNYPGTLKGKGGGSDIVVTKLNATGTGIIGSLRIGGTSNDGVNIKDQVGASMSPNTTFRFYGDDSRSEVILDAANNIYVAAQTQSAGADGMPVTTGVFQPNSAGGQDGTVMKINPTCTDLVWCSYIGGRGTDGAFVIAINPANSELYVAGVTTSDNLPGDKTGVYQSTNQGGLTDGFISRISNDGGTIIKTTYMGTGSFDAIYGIHFDRSNIPYIMGVTEGSWPVINAAYSVPNSKQFIAKVKPDLSGFIYSTVFGNGSARPNMSPVAFLVDRCENIYISGWGGWLVPNTNNANMDGIANMPITPDAIKATTDNRDFYFIVIKRDAAGLLYGTYFGQEGGFGEHVDGGTSRYDEQGVIYQAICANCGQDRDYPITRRFPTTPGVWAPANGSRDCNLGVVKIAFNFAGVASGPKAYFNNLPDTMGCVPFTLTFRDTVRNAKSYEWDFDGDGVTDRTTTSFEQSFTFNAIGTYRVRLIAIDPTTCNQRDTAYVTIRVKDDPANLRIRADKDGPCTSLQFKFTNLSTPPAGKPFGPKSFGWDFGDGTPITPTDNSPVTHNYTAPGTYAVRLILLDTSYCNSGDWLPINLGVVANVDARMETPSMGCAPYDAFFNNTSLGGHDYLWDFGDGTTSTEMSPTHHYANVGTYIVRLTVIDSNTCNKIDSIPPFTLTINTKPTSAFSITPTTPEVNKPTTFLNQAIGGVRYKWLFGDGDSTITTDMRNVSHQYNATGDYLSHLITFNEFGCTDTADHMVAALIDPLLDVPNAFTPGRGNRASIVRVAGFGIGKMQWRIFNRWGQKVFETSDRNAGWDGTFQGKLQPMDVYTYTLDVVFTDGRTQRKTGDITLIR